MKRNAAKLLLAMLLASEAGSAAAEMLVVQSTGPSARQIRPGARLAEGARLQLRRGDRLVLLDARGTRQIRGPRLYVVGARSVSREQVEVALVRNRLGGVRSGLDRVAANTVNRLLDEANAASRRGDFAASDALLAQIGSEWDFEHRAECRLVENLRFYNAIAQRRSIERRDRCASLALAPGTEALEAQLDRERTEVWSAATTGN